MSSEKKTGRAPGEGSVDLLPSGKWRVRVRLPNGTRVTRTCATELEANELRRALVYELGRAPELFESTTPCGDWTLKRWGEHWLDRREVQRLSRYVDRERSMWARHVLKSSLGEASIGSIRPRDIRAFISELLSHRKDSGKGLRTQTIANVTNLLRKALADAVADELIPNNPASGVSIPRRRGEAASETSYLTAAEVDAVATCDRIPERERHIFTVAIFTGLRAGELWALRWGDIELEGERPQITVRRSHRNAPKNGKVQTVPLLEPARAALIRTREILSEREPDDLVFPTKRGFQRQPNDDAGWCTRKRKKGVLEPGLQELAGITRRVRFHDLRHTCASHLVMGTWGSPWPLADVSKMLRHSSITVTERYAHLAPGYLHEQARRTARTAVMCPRPSPSSSSPPASPDVVTQVLGHDLSHPSGLNRRPAVYETAALPLS